MRNLVAILGALLASVGAAQPISQLPDPVEGDIAKRGTAHVRLDPLVGDWDTTIKFWDGPEQDQPIELAGSVHREWVFGGRFLEEHIEEHSDSDIYLNEARGRRPETHAGVVYHGMGLYGYDRLTGLYEHIYMMIRPACTTKPGGMTLSGTSSSSPEPGSSPTTASWFMPDTRYRSRAWIGTGWCATSATRTEESS